MLAPAQPAIAGESSREAEPSVPPNGPFSDPNFESTSTQAHDSIPDPVPSTNVEDESLGGTFFATPPRSPAAPPKGTTSRGVADPLNLTALCTLVSEQGKKIENLESELQAHKLLFKEVMGKLVKRVKFLESKLKARRRKVFVSESDNKEAEEQDVDPLIKLASWSLNFNSQSNLYTDDDWIHIMGQVHANQGLTADLLGPDVTEENFAERMVKVIAERRRQFETQRFIEKRNKPMTYAQQKNFMRTYVKNQSSVIYSTGWTLKHVKSFSDATLQEEFNRIRHAVENLQTQILRRSIKRPGADLDQPTSKKVKYVTPVSPPKPSDADVTPDTSKQRIVAPTPSFSTHVSRSSGPRKRSQSSAADIKTYSTRKKSLATRKMPSFEVDLNAPDTFFIKLLSDDDSDDSDDDTNPLFWYAFAASDVIPTGLGDVNALYFTDKSSKYFTHLREILHLIDRQDLSKLYGMVVKHYEVNPLADTPYPLSASLMKKMLKHKLEVEIDGIGNDMTYAVQLIQFIKNQLASFLIVAGPNRLASPRVNGYLVKASSNPFTFYDSPLPGVNTPWDVMRIVCNPELMDVAEVVQSWLLYGIQIDAVWKCSSSSYFCLLFQSSRLTLQDLSRNGP
ncbi:hypothetical protein Tco_1377836, partial [Tanacetum coccineum]